MAIPTGVKPAQLEASAKRLGRAADALGVAAKKTGLESEETRDAAKDLRDAIKQETKFVSHASPRGGKPVISAFTQTGKTIDRVETLLDRLTAKERKARIAAFVPEGTQWPKPRETIWDARLAASWLKTRAKEHPQALEFNGFPIVVKPGQSAEAAVQAWQDLQRDGPIERMSVAVESLGFEVDDRRSEAQNLLEIEKLRSQPPRSEKELRRYLTRASSEYPNSFATAETKMYTEGLRRLLHPDEIKWLAQSFFDAGPQLDPDSTPYETHRGVVQLIHRYIEEGTVPEGTAPMWRRERDRLQRVLDAM